MSLLGCVRTRVCVRQCLRVYMCTYVCDNKCDFVRVDRSISVCAHVVDREYKFMCMFCVDCVYMIVLVSHVCVCRVITHMYVSTCV